MSGTARKVSFSSTTDLRITFFDGEERERHEQYRLKNVESVDPLFYGRKFLPIGTGAPYCPPKRAYPKRVEEIYEVRYLRQLQQNERDVELFPTENIQQQFSRFEHKIYHLYEKDLSDLFDDQPKEFQNRVSDPAFNQALWKAYREYQRILTKRKSAFY